MATFDFFAPVNMFGNASGPTDGYGTRATSGWIQLTGPNWTDDYFGYGFTYSGNTVSGGVLTDYYSTVNGSMSMAITGMQASAAAAAYYIAHGDTFNALGVMASGNDIITCWSGAMM